MPLSGDTPAAVAWLRAIAPSGPWFLYAADSTEQVPGLPVRRFVDPDVMAAWIDERQGRYNLYYSPNTPLPTIIKHPLKSEIVYINFLHIDVDLPSRGIYSLPTSANFARLLRGIDALIPSPPLLVFSGGGYQALWRLEQPLPGAEYAERVEGVNAAIVKLLSADHCWNINRILRLPGTINSPSPTKLAKHPSRTPALAYVVRADYTATWSFARDTTPRWPDGFSLFDADEDDEDDDSPITSRHHDHTLDALPRNLQRMIVTGDAKAYNGDRSKLVFHLVSSLVRRGWTDEEITPFILDAAYPLSAHCRSKPTPARTAQRQLDRVRAAQSEDWVRSEKGAVLTSHPKNVRKGLDIIGVRFTKNIFADQAYVNGIGPLRPLTDDEANSLRVRNFVDEHGFTPGKDIWYDVLADLAYQSSYHPVADYLNDARQGWDGTDRVDNWLFTYGRVERRVAGDDITHEEANLYNQYICAVGRLMLVAAVRRVRKPGEKFDEMMVFVNPKQGTNKSSALAVLAVRREWFIDSLPLHAKDQEVIEKLSGKWIIEFAEMNGLRTSEVEHLKNFLSRDTDHARKAYGRFVSHPLRQCVFFGSTNEPAFLRDVEDRRFWPVRVGVFDLDALRRDVDQLWGEAAAIEATGESIRLDKRLWDAAAEVQSEHRIEDPWIGLIQEVFKDLKGRVPATQAWMAIGKPGFQRTQEDNRRFGSAMRVAGWERTKQRVYGEPVWCYVRGRRERDRQKIIQVTRSPLPPFDVEASYVDPKATPRPNGHHDDYVPDQDEIPF